MEEFANYILENYPAYEKVQNNETKKVDLSGKKIKLEEKVIENTVNTNTNNSGVQKNVIEPMIIP